MSSKAAKTAGLLAAGVLSLGIGVHFVPDGEGPNAAVAEASGEGPNVVTDGEGPNMATDGEGPNVIAGEGPNRSMSGAAGLGALTA